TVGDRQRTGERQAHHGSVLLGHQVQVHVEVGDVAAAVDLPVHRYEAPASDVPCGHGDSAPRVGLVDVDDQDVARVGFHIVEVGDFRRPGVPHPAAAADLGQ